MSSNYPTGLLLYVDTWGKATIADVERCCAGAGIDGLLVRASSQRGVGYDGKLKWPRPTHKTRDIVAALEQQGIKCHLWFWPVPNPHQLDERDNPALMQTLEWAHILGLQNRLIIPDMEDEWFGQHAAAGCFMDDAVKECHAAGHFVMPSTFRHWRHDSVPLTEMSHGVDAVNLQVYTGSPDDCLYKRGKDGATKPGYQDLDTYPTEVIEWAREKLQMSTPIVAAARVYGAPEKKAVSGPKWNLQRFLRHMAAMPPGLPAVALWSYRQLAARPRWWQSVAEWKAAYFCGA